jgi:hypothetical protein
LARSSNVESLHEGREAFEHSSADGFDFQYPDLCGSTKTLDEGPVDEAPVAQSGCLQSQEPELSQLAAAAAAATSAFVPESPFLLGFCRKLALEYHAQLSRHCSFQPGLLQTARVLAFLSDDLLNVRVALAAAPCGIEEGQIGRLLQYTINVFEAFRVIS